MDQNLACARAIFRTIKSRFVTNVSGLWHDRRGVTAIITAIAGIVLMGFAGLAIDVGYWLNNKSRMQGVTDRAAFSGVNALRDGGNSTAMTLQVRATAAASGFVDGDDGTAVVANRPPSSGPNQADTSSVEVLISQPQPQFFTRIFLETPPTVQTRSVAMLAPGEPVCMLALNPTAADTINFAGNPTISAPDCTMVSDSDSNTAVHLQGSVSVTAATIVTPGQIGYTGGAYTLTLGTPALTGAQSVPDPYASTLTHSNLTAGMPTSPACTKSGVTWSGNCVVPGASVNSGNTLSASTRISGGLDIKNGTVNLAPGTYWITDGDLDLKSGSGATLHCTTCTSGGAGVTIILTTAHSSGGTVGTLTLASNANLTLNAPNSGTFAGDVVIQDSNGLPAGTTIHTISNAQANAAETLTGLVYFPKTAITFQGGPDSTGPQCLVLVANTIGFQGNPRFATSGCSSVGLTNLAVPKTVTRVVE